MQRVGWQGVTKENTPCGSLAEEQRSQTALCAKTLRVAGLLSWSGVGLIGTARFGDAPPSPPCSKPKFLAAAPVAIFGPALSVRSYGLRAAVIPHSAFRILMIRVPPRLRVFVISHPRPSAIICGQNFGLKHSCPFVVAVPAPLLLSFLRCLLFIAWCPSVKSVKSVVV